MSDSSNTNGKNSTSGTSGGYFSRPTQPSHSNNSKRQSSSLHGLTAAVASVQQIEKGSSNNTKNYSNDGNNTSNNGGSGANKSSNPSCPTPSASPSGHSQSSQGGQGGLAFEGGRGGQRQMQQPHSKQHQHEQHHDHHHQQQNMRQSPSHYYTFGTHGTQGPQGYHQGQRERERERGHPGHSGGHHHSQHNQHGQHSQHRFPSHPSHNSLTSPPLKKPRTTSEEGEEEHNSLATPSHRPHSSHSSHSGHHMGHHPHHASHPGHPSHQYGYGRGHPSHPTHPSHPNHHPGHPGHSHPLTVHTPHSAHSAHSAHAAHTPHSAHSSHSSHAAHTPHSHPHPGHSTPGRMYMGGRSGSMSNMGGMGSAAGMGSRSGRGVPNHSPSPASMDRYPGSMSGGMGGVAVTTPGSAGRRGGRGGIGRGRGGRVGSSFTFNVSGVGAGERGMGGMSGSGGGMGGMGGMEMGGQMGRNVYSPYNSASMGLGTPVSMGGGQNSVGAMAPIVNPQTQRSGSPQAIGNNVVFSNGRPEMPPPRWYDAYVPFGVEDDKYWLSELQCILRSEFIEAFGTTQTDIILPVHGRNKPIALGQVGIRCMHCKDLPSIDRSPHAIAYPNFISGIYNAFQQMFRLHFDLCNKIPDDVRTRVDALRDSASRGGRKQYWIDSAKRIGLVDTPFGIHFGRDPSDPLPPWGSAGTKNKPPTIDTQYDEEDQDNLGLNASGSVDNSPSFGDGMGEEGEMDIEEPEYYPLVLPEDKPLINDYLHLALEQMQPCNLMDADRVGCYKGRKIGFPGLACKHCVGQAGCGRYFPASEASLSQTTTSQTIVNHVRNCRRCPIEIREQLEFMKRAKTGPDFKKADKPKHGGRKVFFHRLWCRIQRIPLPKYEKVDNNTPMANKRKPEQNELLISSEQENAYPTHLEEGDEPPVLDYQVLEDQAPELPPSEFQLHGYQAHENQDRENESRDYHGEDYQPQDVQGLESLPHEYQPHEFQDHGTQAQSTHEDHGIPPNQLQVNQSQSEESSDSGSEPETKQGDMQEQDATVSDFASSAATDESDRGTGEYMGQVRLSRDDDTHWLSDAHCFIRQELTEAFTAKEEDVITGGASEVGQVGIRCVYCAENKKPEDRLIGHVYYPTSITSIQQVVSDLQRRHFQLCHEIPDDIRETFKSLKGFGSKTESDTSQYWIDAARELGLADSHEGKGVRFFRNPLDNSPADDLEWEKTNKRPTGSVLVHAEDRNECTDHLVLLLKQFQPCQFNEIDKKGVSHTRGRDRDLGFPGLECIHCENKRYFPLAQKNLMDTTNLMITHVSNCASTPMEVKASLAYLQHRGVLQKAELGSMWKFSFFKRVWERLHHLNEATGDVAESEHVGDCEDNLKTTNENNIPQEEDDMQHEKNPEDVATTEMTDNAQIIPYDSEPHREDVLEEMKDLIKVAAIWLCERDADIELARSRAGRGRGMPQPGRTYVGRGRPPRAGRGRAAIAK